MIKYLLDNSLELSKGIHLNINIISLNKYHSEKKEKEIQKLKEQNEILNEKFKEFEDFKEKKDSEIE